MPRVRTSKAVDDTPRMMIFCPGCKCAHALSVNGVKNTRGASWNFNGDMERPTFTPSLLQDDTRPDGSRHVCHSFITDGRIQFLSDSTHELSGQTVELPEF